MDHWGEETEVELVIGCIGKRTRVQPQPLGIRLEAVGHRYGEECGLTGEMFMGKITKNPLMRSI